MSMHYDISMQLSAIYILPEVTDNQLYIVLSSYSSGCEEITEVLHYQNM